MMLFKVYGDEKTHLSLTEKAYAAYSNEEPFDICEVEKDDHYVYFYKNHFGEWCDYDFSYSLSEEEINEYLESIYDLNEEFYEK